MLNFYHKNLPNIAQTQAPLNKLTGNSKKNDTTPINWTSEQEQAFNKCKEDLSNAASLVYPAPNTKLRLVIDASDSRMGDVLAQKSEKSTWESFFSKNFSPA